MTKAEWAHGISSTGTLTEDIGTVVRVGHGRAGADESST
jgi:hypothetical protein